jgi:hypothetical protein
MKQPTEDLLESAGVIALMCALAILSGFAVGGCKSIGAARTAVAVAGAQAPGQASGAGASVLGPTNSASPTTQIAERRTAYFPPNRPPSRPVVHPQGQGLVITEAPEAHEMPAEAVSAAIDSVSPPAPAWTYERTETTLGAHQDAAGLLKAAMTLAQWGVMRWFGIALIFIAGFGLAWAHNNPDGYPVVFWKLGACGLALAIFDPNPWWGLILLIPFGFWYLQKLGLLKIPGL